MEGLKTRYLVTVDDKEFDIYLYRAEGKHHYFVEYNNSKFKVNVDELSSNKFLFKINDRSSEVDISRNGGNLEVYLDGREMNVRVEPYSLAELRKKTGAAVGGAEEAVIRAPMPGLVLAAKVKTGDNVKKGQTLVIIEAMKMENMIKSPVDGIVKDVFVDSGQAVDKSDKLVELE